MTRNSVIACVAGVVVLAGAAFGLKKFSGSPKAQEPTFCRDIAPIVFSQCAQCHREGGVGPFPLIEYADVKKRAKQIAELTEEHIMPPWLPEPSEPGAEFVGERRLTDARIKALRRWQETGAPEGNVADLPPKPSIPKDWQLGEPDLVVTMPESYTLPPEGRDVYRNFVAQIPNKVRRFVRAIEMRPGNPRVVHHAFIYVNRSGSARRLDEADKEVGYPGMDPGAGSELPNGHFLSWNPGKMPAPHPEGTQWLLEPGSDAVFQLHMKPTGKPEEIRASVAFYFSQMPPTRFPVRVLLRSLAIDIPAGEANYTIESSYKLPVAVDVLGIGPHAHYLGRDLQGWAEKPDGSRMKLIHIKHWDFNWQGDYRYVNPVTLPAGTTLRMHYTYDNSEQNPYNKAGAKRVQYGEQTTDEMGELWMQVLAHNPEDRRKLEADYEVNWMQADAIARANWVLERDPKNVASRTNLGGVYFLRGDLDGAERELKRALEIDPNYATAYSHLTHVYIKRNDLPNAKAAARKAVELKPDDYMARNNLGYLLMAEGDAKGAVEHLERAVQINPNDALSKTNLAKARAMLEKR
jgi:Flp pilus assembly protein TadD